MIRTIHSVLRGEFEMADKPSYIGLLNAIANGERGGAKIFRNWAKVTTCDAIRGTLQTVAIREAEHALAFEKRLCELGFGLREKENPDLKKTVKLMKSGADDIAKFEHLGYGKKSKGDADELTKLLENTTIDPQTGALLGRFICEERDTVRRLNACYETLKNTPETTARPALDATTLDQVCAQLATLTEKVDAMSRLKAVR
jgi:rubrerythrin